MRIPEIRRARKIISRVWNTSVMLKILREFVWKIFANLFVIQIFLILVNRPNFIFNSIDLRLGKLTNFFLHFPFVVGIKFNWGSVGQVTFSCKRLEQKDNTVCSVLSILWAAQLVKVHFSKLKSFKGDFCCCRYWFRVMAFVTFFGSITVCSSVLMVS